jgi:hypothetical protein
MRRKIDPAQGQLLSSQMTDARTGVEANAGKDANGKWQVKDNAGGAEVSRGIIATVDGWITVHLVDSYSEQARTTKVYKALPVIANQSLPYCFDEIDVTNSTAALFSTTTVDSVARPNMIICL